MEDIIYDKTYGIKECNGKYRVILDISDDGRGGYYYKYTDLTYKKKSFALKKAEDFVKSLYKPFTDFQGRRVSFRFINMGEI